MFPFSWKNLLKKISDSFKDESFLHSLHIVEKIVAKVLSLGLLFIILFSIVELFKILIEELIINYSGHFFKDHLLYYLGLFLNILIILEVLENITVYLKENAFSVDLVVVTALTAVARKIIIFDIKTNGGTELIAISGSLLALSISYWLLKHNHNNENKK